MKTAAIRLEDYDTDQRAQATVLANRRITAEESADEVRELVLEVQRPDFSYDLGQSIGVLAPGSPTPMATSSRYTSGRSAWQP